MCYESFYQKSSYIVVNDKNDKYLIEFVYLLLSNVAHNIATSISNLAGSIEQGLPRLKSNKPVYHLLQTYSVVKQETAPSLSPLLLSF